MDNIEFKSIEQTNFVPNTNKFSIDKAIVTIQPNKLLFTEDALLALNAKVNDRIAINYWTIDSSNTFPVIGKAEVFSDSTNGNRLTKIHTISFRGTQNEILKEYGTKFRLIPFKNYFKMEKIDSEIES